MKILFLHPNFPAQFRHLLYYHVSRSDDVSFLCQTHFGRVIPGVNRIAIKSNPDPVDNQQQVDKMIACGKSYKNAFIALREQGYEPDIVISHCGWGCGLHIRDIWPHVLIGSYHEWWFTTESAFNNRAFFKTSWMHQSIVSEGGSYLRNSLMAFEMCNANFVFTPTDWQRLTLPMSLRNLCQVCFDGLDTEYFHPLYASNNPENLSNDKPTIITYGTRGMEPIRGFPEFVLSVKQLFEQGLNIRVRIAGEDDTFYFRTNPPYSETWGDWAKQELQFWVSCGLVEFLGRLPKPQYRLFLQNSDVHVYLSVDYVVSWSFFDALACGCCIVAWDTLSIRTCLQNIHSINLCVPGDVGSLTCKLRDLASNKLLKLPFSELARQESACFGVQNSVKKWESLLESSMF